jgi:hypothetical protein
MSQCDGCKLSNGCLHRVACEKTGFFVQVCRYYVPGFVRVVDVKELVR